jgi:hypothetical protein
MGGREGMNEDEAAAAPRLETELYKAGHPFEEAR